jgi:transposase-like protein
MGAIVAEVVDVGEKRDSRGRRVFPSAERGKLMGAYRASGMTMAEFARREGINYSTMAGWVHRDRPKCAESTKRAIEFAQVQLPMAAMPQFPAASRAELEVRLPDGTVLRGGRVTDLVTLVKALRS